MDISIYKYFIDISIYNFFIDISIYILHVCAAHKDLTFFIYALRSCRLWLPRSAPRRPKQTLGCARASKQCVERNGNLP